MDGIILNEKYPNSTNIVNCDIWYGHDQDIKIDSLGYYNRLLNKGIFYDRSKINYSKCHISELEILQLNSIKKIFSRNNTNYKIIISPNYDQIPLEKEQIELLGEIFGKRNVYNFSGKNRLTEEIGNYYEASHFRPNVANEIFENIYYGIEF